MKLGNCPLDEFTRALFDGLAGLVHPELEADCERCGKGRLALYILHPREVPPGSHRPPFRGCHDRHHEYNRYGSYPVNALARVIYEPGSTRLVLEYEDNLLAGPHAQNALCYYFCDHRPTYDLTDPGSLPQLQELLERLWLTQDIPPPQEW